MFVNTLSGRFLLITTAFVVLAEVFILVPALSGFREDYLLSRLERAQLASLAVLASERTIQPELERELLANAGVYNVVLQRSDLRQLVLSSPIPLPISALYDLREATPFTLARDALADLFAPAERVVRVIGEPVQGAGQFIEVATNTAPLKTAMWDYGLRLLGLSAVFSLLTALLLFLAVQRLMVSPMRRVISHMSAYAESPEDARRFIEPTAHVVELRAAEDALQQMQHQLTGALKQKARLAQLGQAVAKISHDLRNILTTAQLLADRMESSNDPAVKKAAPKLMGSISRAVNLCETTLAFGKAEEPPPTLSHFSLQKLADEVIEGDGLTGARAVDYVTDIPPGFRLRADREQLHRVLANLVKNARQAIESTGQPGTIEIGAGEDDGGWWIRLGDTGPGLPEKAREFLFQPFQGGSRKGGTGLGLAIAAELIKGHGGALELVRSDSSGTEFRIRLPREVSQD